MSSAHSCNRQQVSTSVDCSVKIINRKRHPFHLDFTWLYLICRAASAMPSKIEYHALYGIIQYNFMIITYIDFASYHSSPSDDSWKHFVEHTCLLTYLVDQWVNRLSSQHTTTLCRIYRMNTDMSIYHRNDENFYFFALKIVAFIFSASR